VSSDVLDTAIGMGLVNEQTQSSSGQEDRMIYENPYAEGNAEFASTDIPSIGIPPTTLTAEDLEDLGELLESENNGSSENDGALDYADFNPNSINADVFDPNTINIDDFNPNTISSLGDLEDYTFNQPDSNGSPDLTPLLSSANVPANEDCDMTELIANALIPINDGLSYYMPEEMQEEDLFVM